MCHKKKQSILLRSTSQGNDNAPASADLLRNTYVDGLIEDLKGQVFGVHLLGMLENRVDSLPSLRVFLELVKQDVGFLHLNNK